MNDQELRVAFAVLAAMHLKSHGAMITSQEIASIIHAAYLTSKSPDVPMDQVEKAWLWVEVLNRKEFS